MIPSWIILVLSEDIALRFVMHAKIHNFSGIIYPSSTFASLFSAIFKDELAEEFFQMNAAGGLFVAVFDDDGAV